MKEIGLIKKEKIVIMKIRGMFCFLAGLTVFFCLGVVPDCLAELVLDKGKITEVIVPGQVVSGALNLRNTGNDPIRLKIYFEDFLYKQPFDGTKKFLPMGSTDYSCGEWVQISPQELVLPPLTSKKVTYLIKPPSELKKGGYYGVLFFENMPGEQAGGGLQIITRVGCLFFLETAGSQKRTRLVEPMVTGNRLDMGFLNEGEIIVIAKVTYYVMDSQGMAIDRGEVNTFYLPPKEKFPVSIEMNKNLAPGKYTIVLTFDLGEGEVIVREVDLTKSSLGISSVAEIRD